MARHFHSTPSTYYPTNADRRRRNIKRHQEAKPHDRQPDSCYVRLLPRESRNGMSLVSYSTMMKDMYPPELVEAMAFSENPFFALIRKHGRGT